MYISSRPLVAQNPFWFCCCWLVVSYRQGHYLTWTQFLLEEWASKIILFCMPRVSHQPLRAQKNSNFFVLPYLLSQFYIIALKDFPQISPPSVSSTTYIYTMTPPLLHIPVGKYVILYYTLVHVCELLKGTHHNTLGLRNHVGCQGK